MRHTHLHCEHPPLHACRACAVLALTRRRAARFPRLCPGRALAMQLAKIGKQWQRSAAARMPTATGDIREIVGQPVFVPLFKLYQIYGKIFKLSFGPKQFVIVSDPEIAKRVSRCRSAAAGQPAAGLCCTHDGARCAAPTWI